MLENLGYDVLAAANQMDAIDLVEKQPGTIQLLITDVIMPEINGRELAEQIREVLDKEGLP